MQPSSPLPSTASILPDPRYRAARGYLAACTLGIPARPTVEAVERDLRRWSQGAASAAEYSAVAERARGKEREMALATSLQTGG